MRGWGRGAALPVADPERRSLDACRFDAELAPVGQALAAGIPLDDPSFRPSCPACCLGFVAIFVGLPYVGPNLIDVLMRTVAVVLFDLVSCSASF